MIGANVDEDDDLVDNDYSDYYVPILLTTLFTIIIYLFSWQLGTILLFTYFLDNIGTVVFIKSENHSWE